MLIVILSIALLFVSTASLPSQHGQDQTDFNDLERPKKETIPLELLEDLKDEEGPNIEENVKIVVIEGLYIIFIILLFIIYYYYLLYVYLIRPGVI